MSSAHAGMQRPLDLGHELVVDLFAGGGGASLGITWALGRGPDVAVNHDAQAVAVHTINHPDTAHYREDVFAVDPRTVTRGLPVGLLWASPDCKHFSRAKGRRPVSRRVRSLAWVVVRWARAVRPRVIALENVQEFAAWGPVSADGIPCARRRGETFARFLDALRRQGYQVEYRALSACDYGAPTIRRRLFLVARRDGRPIVWPAPTHGDPRSLPVQRGRLHPWRTAAQCIDWSLPCPSIFGRARPLADATLARIAAGVRRFVAGGTPDAVHGAQGELIAAFLAKHYTGVVGTRVSAPLGTVTTVDHHALVTVQVTPCAPGDLPPAKHGAAAQVAAFLIAYYGNERDACNPSNPMRTVTTRERFALVEVCGQTGVLTDIGMRMLSPRELYRAQGFPDTYCIERGEAGERIGKAAQIRLCGNSVCPPLAQAIVTANFRHEQRAAAGLSAVAA